MTNYNNKTSGQGSTWQHINIENQTYACDSLLESVCADVRLSHEPRPWSWQLHSYRMRQRDEMETKEKAENVVKLQKMLEGKNLKKIVDFFNFTPKVFLFTSQNNSISLRLPFHTYEFHYRTLDLALLWQINLQAWQNNWLIFCFKVLYVKKFTDINECIPAD